MDFDIELRFQRLKKHLEHQEGEGMDIQAILFLIGVNELGLLATTEGPVHDQILSDGAVTESLVDFASEQLEEEVSTLGVSGRLAARLISFAQISY